MMTNGLVVVVVVVVALSELVIGYRRRLAAISSSLNSIVRRASLYPVRAGARATCTSVKHSP